MSVKPSLSASIYQLRALVDFIDQGSVNATFVFYDDIKPESTAVAANDSAKLVSLQLPKPCFKQLLNDGIELFSTDTAMPTKAGTAVWARLYNGNGQAVADFELGADIILNTYEMAIGATQTLDSIIFKVM